MAAYKIERVRLTADLTKYDPRCKPGELGMTTLDRTDYSSFDRFTKVRFDNGAYLDVLWEGLEVVYNNPQEEITALKKKRDRLFEGRDIHAAVETLRQIEKLERQHRTVKERLETLKDYYLEHLSQNQESPTSIDLDVLRILESAMARS